MWLALGCFLTSTSESTKNETMIMDQTWWSFDRRCSRQDHEWWNPDRTGHLNGRFHRSLTSRAAFLNTWFWYVWSCETKHAYCCKDLVGMDNQWSGWQRTGTKNSKDCNVRTRELWWTLRLRSSNSQQAHERTHTTTTFTWLHQKLWTSMNNSTSSQRRPTGVCLEVTQMESQKWGRRLLLEHLSHW